MPIQNVVLLSDLAACIEQTIAEVNKGISAARSAGVQVELPTDIAFEFVVIKDWQALDLESAESGNTIETQGGENVETRISDGTEDQSKVESSTKDDTQTRTTGDTTIESKTSTGTAGKNNNNAHNEQNEETYESTDT